MARAVIQPFTGSCNIRIKHCINFIHKLNITTPFVPKLGDIIINVPTK